MKDRTLQELSTQITGIYNSYTTTGTEKWTWITAAHDLPYQLGSLKRREFEFIDNPSDKKIKAALADIMTESIFIIGNLGFNINDLFSEAKSTSGEITLSDVSKHSHIECKERGYTWERSIDELTILIGDIAKATMMLNNERHSLGRSAETLHGSLVGISADILTHVLFISKELKIDPIQAFDKMINERLKIELLE